MVLQTPNYVAFLYFYSYSFRPTAESIPKIDENANPHSDALHVVERWTRPDADDIHVETPIDDPKFYTKPFTYQRTWLAGAPDQVLGEYSCSENNVDRDHLGPGPIRKQ
jgi:hypothetical protein